MYNQKAIAAAFAAASADRSRALAVAIERKEQIEQQYPRMAAIARELSDIGASIAKTFYSQNPQQSVDALAVESLRLQEERKALLESLDLPQDYLEPQFYCKTCSDTGRVEGKLCNCIKQRAIDYSLEELARISPSERCSFENFDLAYYKNITDQSGKSVYEKAKANLEYLKAYSEDFSEHSKSLYLFGKTGLGKTHLTLAAAKAVIRKGYDVVYGMAGAVFADIEKEKFKSLEGKYTMQRLLEADLLILDDLGSEFQTSFSAAVAHNIIEGRLLAGKPVIITTNLDIDGIHSQYGERIASRIIGEYVPIKFEGNDVRQLRKFRY
ncbi:MAG: ATP-binding protein [Clostridia bacterium]|nr:ATP-binding protein [Clostridia bacterium]